MSFPVTFKYEFVLSFKFTQVGSTWKRTQESPRVVRLTNHDCRQEFREPGVIWSQSRAVIEVRIYDDLGIDITNAGTLLGDWTRAQTRCEEFLATKFQQADV